MISEELLVIQEDLAFFGASPGGPASQIVSVITRSGLILGLWPANERRCYKVTPSLIGLMQT